MSEAATTPNVASAQNPASADGAPPTPEQTLAKARQVLVNQSNKLKQQAQTIQDLTAASVKQTAEIESMQKEIGVRADAYARLYEELEAYKGRVISDAHKQGLDELNHLLGLTHQ